MIPCSPITQILRFKKYLAERRALPCHRRYATAHFTSQRLTTRYLYFPAYRAKTKILSWQREYMLITFLWPLIPFMLAAFAFRRASSVILSDPRTLTAAQGCVHIHRLAARGTAPACRHPRLYYIACVLLPVSARTAFVVLLHVRPPVYL